MNARKKQNIVNKKRKYEFRLHILNAFKIAKRV